MALSNTAANGECLNYLLHRSFTSHPENIAATDSNKTLTYDELEKCSNSAANMLIRDREKIPGNNVCIVIGSYAERLCAVAGVLKAGMTYVPIDLKAPLKNTRRPHI